VNDAFGQPQSMISLGGGSDISRAVVRKLAAQRCTTVVLAGRPSTWMEVAQDEARQAGATTVVTTTCDANEVEDAPGAVERAFAAAGGPVDLVLMAVGELGTQAADEVEPSRTAQMITVNFTWPAAAMAAIAQRLRVQGYGRIVVLSTVAGVRVRRINYTYGSAKAGLDAHCQGLAEALRGSGVSLQIVRPGFVRSKMTEGRPAAPFAVTPDDVAEAVVHGLETGAPVIWVPPPLRYVFAVLRQLPAALWRRLPG
jgi:decaprenylphospho-beta-D-erythro-pentofuranosid-2-ulose 2-reductase